MRVDQEYLFATEDRDIVVDGNGGGAARYGINHLSQTSYM